MLEMHGINGKLLLVESMSTDVWLVSFCQKIAIGHWHLCAKRLDTVVQFQQIMTRDILCHCACRVQEGTFKVAETTSELQIQRRRNALLEKQLGKAKVDQTPPGA